MKYPYGVERLQIMYEMFHQEEERKFEFSYDRILQSGMTTKDFIAPTSFLFKSGKDFQMGDTIGAVSYLNILAPELTDKVLAEFLDMDKNLVVSIHVQSVDQLKAIKLIKGKITDLDRMKIEEQKKAVRSGYDMEIIPSDLATYGGEAKKILDDLQSRNERMFLITVLFLNAAKTKQDLDSAVFQTAGIAQKFNCTLNRLDYMPYVWGGSSPSTSFDCSGFVCWVINNCGNGWNVGRTTANGLRGKCSYVSPANAGH